MTVPWYASAACRGKDPDATLFFGLDGERGPERDRREAQAKAICRSCPVKLQCGNYAIGNAERYGIWGGFSEEERAAERRRRQRRQREYAA